MQVVNPDPEQLPRIFAGIPADTAIVMVNLLRFRAEARYKDGSQGGSGRVAYGRYSALVLPMLAHLGAAVIFAGDAKGALIAPPGEDWDEVLLVRYPSIQAFMGMMAAPEFREASRHRTAALEDARLIATVALPTDGTSL